MFRLFFIIMFFIISLSCKLVALENKILFKVDNEIITTIDISNEINYLKMINKEIQQLDKDTIIEISTNSLIRDKIKKLELLKNLKDLNLKKEDLDQLIKKSYNNLGLKNKDEFNSYLKRHEVKITKFVEKISTEIYWNEMIYSKHKDRIRIDRKKITTEVSQKKNKSYLLSEIMFNVENKENLKKKFNSIKNTIDTNGFKNAALIHGISDSSKNGGNLGWINENSISPKIYEKISIIKIGEYTNPILIPGGFLIIKIKDYKEEKIKFNIEEEINKVIQIKTNDQLRQFSNIYFNKIKKDIIINEL
jgi:peptidyl-prolyl cis-trans isomerase SurA